MYVNCYTSKAKIIRSNLNCYISLFLIFGRHCPHFTFLQSLSRLRGVSSSIQKNNQYSYWLILNIFTFGPLFSALNWLFCILPLCWCWLYLVQKNDIFSKCSNASVAAVFLSKPCEKCERKCRTTEGPAHRWYTTMEATSRFSGQCKQNGPYRTTQPRTPASMRRQYLENYKQKRPLQLHLQDKTWQNVIYIIASTESFHIYIFIIYRCICMLMKHMDVSFYPNSHWLTHELQSSLLT